jgi:hypothetical protein
MVSDPIYAVDDRKPVYDNGRTPDVLVVVQINIRHFTIRVVLPDLFVRYIRKIAHRIFASVTATVSSFIIVVHNNTKYINYSLYKNQKQFYIHTADTDTDTDHTNKIKYKIAVWLLHST